MPVICLGTYSGGLIGAALEEDEADLKLVFAMGVHSGPVRCLATAGSCLISGGADEASNVFDLGKNCEIGAFDGHEADVLSVDIIAQGTALHALTGGADGKIAVFKRGGNDWKLLNFLKGHRGPVTGIAIHSSGKAALSVAAGDENKLRLWDLVRGTCSVSQQLASAPHEVRWNPAGTVYAVRFSNSVLLRHATVGKAFREFSPGTPDENFGNLSSLEYIDDSTLAIGTTKGEVIVVIFNVTIDSDTSTGVLETTAAERFEVLRGRIKAIRLIEARLLGVVTSDGILQLLRYTLDDEGLPRLNKEVEWESNARVTCMTSSSY